MKKSLNKFTEDFIVSQRGQWDYPGLPTAVPTPSGKITTKGVKDDLIGIDNLGNSQYMTPNNEYQFEGDMVYEIPQVKKGGSKKPSKKLSSSLMAKNILFTKNQLFEKVKSVKNKIFDPNSPYLKEGGAFQIELDDAEIDEYRKGGYVIEDLDAYGPGGEPCEKGYSLVNGECIPDQDCEDGRCEETDQIQNILDEGSYIPKKNVNMMWDVVEQMEKRNPFGNAGNIWTGKGAQSLSKRLGMDNPSNCMWAAGMGYQCLPETKGKLPLMPFESNDKFINAVNKGTVPFSRVAKTHDPNFASQETGMLQQGDIINFKGAGNSHAMTFSHYREDGVPIFLDSNGNATDFGFNTGLWKDFLPNKEKVAYVSRFNPEKFYEKDIKTLEEKARTNPTMIEKQNGGALNKFLGGGPTDCGEGTVWSDELQDCVREQAVHSVTINQYTPYINAWNEMHPREREITQKKAEYLAKHKNLNRRAGVNQDNFPEKVLRNIINKVDYERNNYVIDQYAKARGFNPNKHVDLVENIAEKGRGSYDMAQNSKYGSKLAPSLWSRTLSGVQELGNAAIKLLPGTQGDVLKYKVPGLSKKEAKEKAKSSTGALDAFAILDLPGQAIANTVLEYGKTLTGGTGADYKTKDIPNVISGESMPGVTDAVSAIFNPFMYTGLASVPYLLGNGIVGAGKGVAAIKNIIAGAKTADNVLPIIGQADNVAPLLTKVDDVTSLNKVDDVLSLPTVNNKVSEINWGNWNKEIPKNKTLMQEYNTIEEASKANGTWMKNADGTPFNGTPEQFVQQQSQNFKNAYPEGTTTTYRGDATHTPTLTNKNSVGNSVFTGEENLAQHYTGNTDYYNSNIFSTENKIIPKDQWDSYSEAMKNSTLSKYGDNLKIVDNASDPGLTPAGMHKLYVKNSDNQVIIDAKNAEWHSVENPFSENIRIDKQLGERTKDYAKQGDYVNTDQIARVLEEQGIDKAIINNIEDGKLGNILINNQKPGNYLKSMMGNNGMFDLTNPNIYKAIIPAVGGAGLMLNNPGVLPQKNKYGGALNKFEKEGIILDLSPAQIEEYRKGGYIVKELNTYSGGGSVVGTDGLTDNFSQRLSQFIIDARTQGIDLNVGSGYRSYEKQKKLWEQALKKYGSPEKARKWVAPPGSSNHNKGLAVDLSSSGLFLGKDKNVKATEWAHANAKKYGLNFRMGWEPWHIEPIEKGNSKDDGKTADDHDHSSEFGNDEATKKEKLDLAIKNKELEFENKKLLLAEQEKIKNDDDYSNWTPRKKIEDADPTKALLESYSKIMNPSLQNINDIYTSNLQGQMKRGCFIMDLEDDEIKKYIDGGYIVKEIN